MNPQELLGLPSQIKSHGTPSTMGGHDQASYIASTSYRNAQSTLQIKGIAMPFLKQETILLVLQYLSILIYHGCFLFW